jgi:hypothetical protein
LIMTGSIVSELSERMTLSASLHTLSEPFGFSPTAQSRSRA